MFDKKKDETSNEEKGLSDVFRPATKSEGMRQKIMKNSFPYYPRIMTDVHSGRDLRIILKNS